MACAALTLTELPRIGFAHHLRVESYSHTPTHSENSLEIVYVKEGAINAVVGGHAFVIPSGGIAVIPRNLPFAFETTDGKPNEHCSVQLKMVYTVRILEDSDQPPAEFSGLLLPLVLPPSPDTETIKKDLYAIVSDMDLSRRERESAAAVTALGILGKLDRLRHRQSLAGDTASLWAYRIKQYVSRHVHEEITLGDIAAALGKTPNYLNSVFREATGSPIHRYIGGEKVRLITELLETRTLSFKAACAAVSIDDVSYGYRLFKKYTGLTTRAYRDRFPE